LKHRRPAARTKIASGVVVRLARDGHRIFWEDRGSVKQGSMVLAAVETVANADPVREPQRDNPDIATQTAAREPVHLRLLNGPRSSNESSLSPGRMSGQPA